jgi:hypothetical protein
MALVLVQRYVRRPMRCSDPLTGRQLLIVGSSIATLEMVTHGFGEAHDDLSISQSKDIWIAFVVAQLLFYAGAACSLWTVSEFMEQLKGIVRVPLLSVVKYAAITWGVAGAVIMATFARLAAKSPVVSLINAKPTVHCLMSAAHCFTGTRRNGVRDPTGRFRHSSPHHLAFTDECGASDHGPHRLLSWFRVSVCTAVNCGHRN